jgi:hypothetical protein
MKEPCAGTSTQGSKRGSVTQLFALIRHEPIGMRTMRRGRSHALRGNGEVVETALDIVATGERRVVGHHCARYERATGGTRSCWPFRWANGGRNVTEAFARGSSAHATTRGSSMRAMHVGRALGSTGVVDATAERIAGRIGIFAFHEIDRPGHTAFLARPLRIGARAVGHDVRAVFVQQARAAARATRTGRTAAGAARGAFAAGAARAARRAGAVAGLGFLATERNKRS